MDLTYIAIDLRSFYASVECADRQLDPLTTNLVVADQSRTDKTICLAVSPALKACGIPGRPRLFEVVQKVRQATPGGRDLRHSTVLRANPRALRNWRRTQPWNWTTSSPFRAWPVTSRSARRSTAFT